MGSTGVRLMTSSAVLCRWWMAGATDRWNRRHVVTARADFGPACGQQTRSLGGVSQMAGVAVTGGEGLVLGKILRRLQHSVVAL